MLCGDWIASVKFSLPERLRSLRPPRQSNPNGKVGCNRTILPWIRRPCSRQNCWRCAVSSVQNPRPHSSALPKQQDIQSYGLHSPIPNYTPWKPVGRWSKTMVRQSVTLPWQDSAHIERTGVRKSPPQHAARRLLRCAVKKTAIGGRTWRSQKSKALRTRWDSKKSAKSYETDYRL